MSQYESADGIQNIINNAAESGALSASTAAAIKDLLDQLGDAAPAATATVGAGETLTAAAVSAGTQLIIMDSDSRADVKFDANSDVTAMVVGGAGNSTVEFATSKDVTVQLGGGENDSVSTGAGNDNITFAGGSATIDTGAGNDVVTLQGEGSATINAQGGGTLNVVLESTEVAATVNAGDGFDLVSFAGSVTSMIFSFIGNAFHMVARSVGGRSADDGIATQADDTPGILMDGVNVVSFTDAAGTPEHITVLATDQQDVAFASLYKIALGRQGIDYGATEAQGGDLGGINFWTTQFDEDRPIDQAVASFMACDEVQAKLAGAGGVEGQVKMFFDNLGVTTVNGMTATEYAQLVNVGSMTINDVAQQMALSQEAVNVLGVNGETYVIAAPDVQLG